jgi:hypothetical protein
MNTTDAAAALGKKARWVRIQCAAGELRASYFTPQLGHGRVVSSAVTLLTMICLAVRAVTAVWSALRSW